MNHIYRVIFNRVLGCWQAVTELAKSSGKMGGSVKRNIKRNTRRHATKLAAIAAMAAGTGGLAGQASAQNAPAPNQLPQGGNVAAGQANINSSGNVMNIDQSTQKAIINWQEFNVGQDATVNFNQPGRDAATLNRVLDANPSQIFGRIVAPGQVILINPNGAYFAPSASVDVGGLIATTHELADKDFLDGNYAFKRNGATGKIINEGELKAKLDGYIALMAPEVRNQGVIIAERGTVALASGEHIQLDFGTGNKLQGITVTEQDFDAQIENKHAIIAEGGLVILSARATAELRASVIKNSGQIVASAGANTVTQKGGRIILEGNIIEVQQGSELIATGPKGGGEVLIGGDWQGGANEERRVFDNPKAVHQATKVTVETNTKIDASATDNGDGGTVVVWSDVKNPDSVTSVQGEILAKGGENGGDGGQIETSGRVISIAGSSIKASSPNGEAGLWLIDPADLTINQATADTYETTLNSGTDVTVDTFGRIEFQNVVLGADIGGDGEATLTLIADQIASANEIDPDVYTIEATTGKLNVVMITNRNSDAYNDGQTQADDRNVGVGYIRTNGGGLWVGAGNAASADWVPYEGGAAIKVGTWNATTGSSTAIKILGNIETSGGNIEFVTEAGDGATTHTDIAAVYANRSINAGSGNITFRQSELDYDYYGYSLTLATTGTLTVAPLANYFYTNFATGTPATFTWDGSLASGTLTGSASIAGLRIESFADLGGLTIGKAGNSSPLSINSDISIAGPISFESGTLTISGHLETTAQGADILAKVNDNLSGANATDGQMGLGSGKNITTNGGNIILWSNASNRTSGQANNEIVLSGSNTLSSSGGKIVLAGGLDDGANDGTAHDGIPDGFAYRGGYIGGAVDIRSNVTLLSGGGDVLIRGQQNGSAAAMNVREGFKLDSGIGTITIHGKNANNHAIGFDWGNFALTSASTAQTAISIKGETSSIAGQENFWSGFLASFNSGSGSALIQATGATGGGIRIEGNNAGGNIGLWLGNSDPTSTLQILSNVGDISLGANSDIYINNQSVYVGARKDATAIQGITPVATAATGDITIRTGDFSFAGTHALNIATTGSVTVEPYGDDFNAAISWPLSNFTLSSDVSGLTIGKASSADGSNDVGVTIGSATSIAGPITVYGGNLTLNQNLTSTAAGAEILLKASGKVTLAANRTIQTNNGDIVLWSNSADGTAGGIDINDNAGLNSANGATNQTAGGGRIVLGGGSEVDGDGLPTGAAVGSGSNMSGIHLGTPNSTSDIKIYSGGGNVSLSGEATTQWGVQWDEIGLIDAGDGSISITGMSTGNHGIELGAFSGSFTLRAAAGVTIEGRSTASAGIAGFQGQNGNILVTGEGSSISITGHASNSTFRGVWFQGNALASSGAITIDGGTKGIGLSSATIGQKVGSDVTASSSDMTLTGDSVTTTASTIASSGTLTVEPFSDSFSSVLTWPVSGLTVGSSLTALTLGKTTNTANITISSAQTIAGPITVYGGKITLNAKLESTAAVEAILLQGSKVVQAAGVTVQTNGGDIT